jgi:hypothetical protein
MLLAEQAGILQELAGLKELRRGTVGLQYFP